MFSLASFCFLVFLLVCFGLWEMFLVFRPASDRGVVALTHPQTDVGHVGER